MVKIKKYTLQAPSKSYNITFQTNPLEKFQNNEGYFLVTDSNLAKHYSDELELFNTLIIPSGESSKNMDQLEDLAEQLIQKGADRSSTLIAFGGGVVGDLTGFLASVYMRGIKYYQIPTSLLAMVDSSIGGKTGVNLNSGKNLIGSFWHPEEVLIDPNYLNTLPKEHFINGMGEVVKYGVLKADFFDWLEKNTKAIMNLEPEILEGMIFQCAAIKGDIVQADEKEGGMRKLLNLGHTFGHALEKLSDYKLPHGLAVAKGMILAGKYAEMEDFDRMISFLQRCGLPHEIDTNIDPEKMVNVMTTDKKNQSGTLTLILPKKVGNVEIITGVEAKKLEKWMKDIGL